MDLHRFNFFLKKTHKYDLLGDFMNPQKAICTNILSKVLLVHDKFDERSCKCMHACQPNKTNI